MTAKRTAPALGLSLILTLSGCTTPEVDPAAPGYDEDRFVSDLNLCRGGGFIAASAESIGIAMLGSAYGAAWGARAASRGNDRAEAAAIGAIVGGTVGLGVGATDALARHRAEIAECLARKGYVLAGDDALQRRRAGPGRRWREPGFRE